MRKNIVAGNWKMNTTLAEGLALAKGLDEALKGKTPNCDVIIGTPFTHLASVAAAIDTNKIGVAAENCADKEKGAYTGEVSSLRSFWLMNRFGLSVQVKPLHPTRQKKFTLISVLLWLLNMVRKSPITARSFTVAAVTQATLRNCLLNRT